MMPQFMMNILDTMQYLWQERKPSMKSVCKWKKARIRISYFVENEKNRMENGCKVFYNR